MKKLIIFINVILLLIILFFSNKTDVSVNLDRVFFNISQKNILGTDNLGRDIFSLVVVGAMRTIGVMVISTSISFFVGIFFGLIAGYFEGKIEIFIKSIVDLLMIIPTFVCALIITSIFGITPITAGISIGVFGIGNYMNQSLFLTKREKQKEYIQASILLGVNWYKILYGRILRNIIFELYVNLGNTASSVILQYSSLTFIGLGADFTKPDWGTMLYQYRVYASSRPILVLLPSLCIFWIAFSINFLFEDIKEE